MYSQIRKIGMGLLSGLSACPVFADHPSVAFGTESAGPIHTISAHPIPAGVWALGLRSEWIDKDAFDVEQLEAFAAQGREGVHSVDTILSTSLSFAYGLNDDLSLTARLPYVARENIRESELEGGIPEAHTHGDSAGFGDLLLFGQYRALRFRETDFSVHLGLKAPTGETHDKDDEGIRFESEFQSGTGSWDYFLGGAVSRTRGRLGYHANLLYQRTTEGSQSTEFGDALFYNAALSYRLDGHDHSPHDHAHTDAPTELVWDLIMELNGATRWKNKVDGETEANSGATTLVLSPGIKLSAPNGFGGFVSIGLPLVENLSGKQTELGTRVVIGVSYAR